MGRPRDVNVSYARPLDVFCVVFSPARSLEYFNQYDNLGKVRKIYMPFTFEEMCQNCVRLLLFDTIALQMVAIILSANVVSLLLPSFCL